MTRPPGPAPSATPPGPTRTASTSGVSETQITTIVRGRRERRPGRPPRRRRRRPGRRPDRGCGSRRSADGPPCSRLAAIAAPIVPRPTNPIRSTSPPRLSESSPRRPDDDVPTGGPCTWHRRCRSRDRSSRGGRADVESSRRGVPGAGGLRSAISAVRSGPRGEGGPARRRGVPDRPRPEPGADAQDPIGERGAAVDARGDQPGQAEGLARPAGLEPTTFRSAT